MENQPVRTIQAKLNETGISEFRLSTYIENYNNKAESQSCIGILSDLPEISYSINYIDGPGKTISDIITGFTGNKLMSLIMGFIITNDDTASYREQLYVGNWSKKIYNGADVSDLTLKFRVYDRSIQSLPTTGNSNFSSAKDWIDLLQKYATISNQNMINGEQAVDNIDAVFDAAYVAGQNSNPIINLIDHLMSNSNAKNSNKPEKTKQNETISKYRMYIYPLLDHIKEYVNMTYKPDKTGTYLHIDTLLFSYNSDNESDGNIKFTINFNYSINGRSNKGNKGHTKDFTVNLKDKETQNAIFDEFINKLETAIRPKNGILAKNFKDKIINNKDELQQILKSKNINFNSIKLPNTDGNMGSMDKNLNLLSQTINAGNTLINYYDSDRVTKVFNVKNQFGERLFLLQLYHPFLFNQKGFPVFITNWTYKSSDEFLKDGTPVYVDFEITCKFDQIYSRNTIFEKLLSQNITEQKK